jgi:hypothetical protein
MNNGAIYDWIVASTGFAAAKVIEESQNGPRPARPFITYGLTALVPSDFSTSVRGQAPGPDPDLVKKQYFNRATITIGINVYAEGGEETLARLNQSTYLSGPRLKLRAGGMSLKGGGAARDLTELGDVSFRPRFQADYDILWFSEVSETVEKILEYVLGMKDEETQNLFVQ